MRKGLFGIGLTLLLVCSMVAVGCSESEEKEAKPEEQKQQDVTEQEETALDTITTESGLMYIELEAGEGAEAQAGMTVAMHYTGWLKTEEGEKGTKFDSSRDRNQPFQFKLGAGMVIKGWDEGIAGMKEGGQRRLIIPSALGYGARGAGNVIPPNADLIFDVEFLNVVGQK